jgi:hypothetical protein
LDALEDRVLTRPEVAALSQEIDLDRNFQYPRIVSRGSAALVEEQLSISDREILQRIVEIFGSKSFAELRGISHETPAYEKAWAVRGNARSASMAFEDFFEEDEEALAGIREDAIENSALRSVFTEAGWD